MSEVGATGDWQLDLVEDIDLAGWVWLPDAFEAGEREAWVDEVVPVLQDHIGAQQVDGTPNAVGDIRGLLNAALDARAESDSYAMYQVWPVHAPAAVMCHVNRVRTEDLPDLDSLEGRRMHRTDGRYIGPGVQVSSRFTADTDDGPMDLAAVYFVFADQEDAVVVHLDPSLPEFIAQSLVGVGIFTNALEVTRGDGTTFSSLVPSGLIADDEWDTDSAGVS